MAGRGSRVATDTVSLGGPGSCMTGPPVPRRSCTCYLLAAYYLSSAFTSRAAAHRTAPGCKGHRKGTQRKRLSWTHVNFRSRRVRAGKKSTAVKKRTPTSLVFEPRAQGLNVRTDSGTGFFPDEENDTIPHDLMRVQITKISVYFFFTRCTFFYTP